MKSLTGHDIHESYTAAAGYARDWDLLSPSRQQQYEQMAEWLNEKAGLNNNATTSLQGEKPDFEDCTFILGYGPGDHDFTTARSIEDLHQRMKEHIPYPNEGQKHHYYIRIHKDGQDLGFGSYERTHTDINIKQETGAAQGLNDALYVYAWEHA